jgi:hypothetical protein
VDEEPLDDEPVDDEVPDEDEPLELEPLDDDPDELDPVELDPDEPDPLELDPLELDDPLDPEDVVVVFPVVDVAVAPIPSNGIVSQLSDAFDEIPMYPAVKPFAVGEYVAVTVAAPPAAIVAGNPVTENPPKPPMLQIETALLPVFFSVIVCVPLVPTFTAPNDAPDGDGARNPLDVLAAAPVPLAAIDAVPLPLVN